MLKAGPLDVLYKFHHKGVKVVVCRYMDTYSYFFAFKGEVYIDFVMPPNEKELRAHKTNLPSIEPKLISHLCAKAQENIEYHKRKGRWYNKFIVQFNETRQRGINEFKTRFGNWLPNWRGINVPLGRPKGSGSEQNNSARQKA